jgi:hypothetical protein
MVSQLAHRIANPDRFAARLANDFAIRCIQIAKASRLDGTAHLVSLRTATIEFVVPSRNRGGSIWSSVIFAAVYGAIAHVGQGLTGLTRTWAQPSSICAQSRKPARRMWRTPRPLERELGPMMRPCSGGSQWQLAGGQW